MIPRGLPKRYATALFNSAVKHNVAEEVRDDGASFEALFDADAEFRNYLLSPQVLGIEKKGILEKVLRGRVSDLFMNFLLLLIAKGRFNYVDEIIDAYHYLYEHAQGILEIQVMTAIPLDDDLQQQLKVKLESQTNVEIRLATRVDPSIVGGVVLKLEDKIIDGSIRHYLETLKRDLDSLDVR